jgi:hypothetical protein
MKLTIEIQERGDGVSTAITGSGNCTQAEADQAERIIAAVHGAIMSQALPGFQPAESKGGMLLRPRGD